MSQKPLIYLASPYTHDDPEVRYWRFKEAERYTAKAIRRGEIIFSPIVYAHTMAANYNLPFTADYWSDFNYRMILHCEEVVVLQLQGWRESSGVKAEITLARDLKRMVRMVWPE